MCTLSVARHSESFIFTHNRDESVKRGLATAPAWHQVNGVLMLHPIDPLGGGTWWALDNKGQCAFLLNGGFEKHQRQLPYKHSRGLIPIQVLQSANIQQFVNTYPFEGLEPFTLIAYIQQQLYELVWTGTHAHFNEIILEHWRIWASSTLYPREWKTARKQWLEQWIHDNNSINANNLWDFHHASFTEERAYDMLMERETHLRTVSVTQIVLPFEGEWPQVRYEDRELHEEVVLRP